MDPEIFVPRYSVMVVLGNLCWIVVWILLEACISISPLGFALSNISGYKFHFLTISSAYLFLIAFALQTCCPSERNVGGNSLLLGLVNSREADIGIQISSNRDDSEENFDMIFSMGFMKKLTKQINKLQFNAIPKAHSYVEKVDKDWVTVSPSTPNSYELCCSIYSSLNACSLDEACVMEVVE